MNICTKLTGCLILMLAIMCPFIMDASEDNTKIVYVSQQPLPGAPIDEDLIGHRSISRLIPVLIDNVKGIDIPGKESSEIVYFEIYDEEGVLLSTFYDEYKFAAFVLSRVNTVEIRIYFDSYLLRGFVNQ